MDEARCVDCSSGDEVTSSPPLLLSRNSVVRMSALMKKGFVDVFNTRMLSLTQWLTL
jgi:hypothetical protein